MTSDSSQTGIESIDDFLPLPGSDDVVTSGGGSANPAVNSGIFKAPEGQADTSFLDEPDKDGDGTGTESADVTSILNDVTGDGQADPDEDGGTDAAGDERKPAGRAKTDKSGLHETLKGLIEAGKFFAFDDDKPLEQYSIKECEELILANIEERERQLKEQTPKEFFESLPLQLQYAAKYVSDGGTNLPGLFAALARVEENRALDITKPEDQAQIARQYLTATGYGTAEEIEEEVNGWVTAGLIERKAGQFKPKLDVMQEQVVQAEVERQANVAKARQEAARTYRENIINTLSAGELAGVKLSKDVQTKLAKGLTETEFTSMVSGRPTNLLGHLLEQHQYGEKPRFDLIAQATWLFQDPEGFYAAIRTTTTNENTEATVRKLKTEQGRKGASGTGNEPPETQQGPRRIARPGANIFKRA